MFRFLMNDNYLPEIAVEDLHVSPFTASIKRLITARFSYRPGYIACRRGRLKAGIIYTQCALVHNPSPCFIPSPYFIPSP